MAAGAHIDIVIKIGGALMAHPQEFGAVLAEIDAAAPARLVVVPGGGPFADTVRDVDRRMHLSDDASHWMAILAMDQYAHLIASYLHRGRIVQTAAEIGVEISARHVPVLAPSEWLRQADPLPHAWSVTSDSIAAWVAGRLGAPRLLLIKPPGVTKADAVDAYFTSALPPDVEANVVAADRVDALRAALSQAARK